MDSKDLLEAEEPDIHSELIEISLISIDQDSCPRKDMGDLEALEASIRKLGIINPIVLGRNNVLISGKRRIQACQNIGMETIPAIRYDIETRSLPGLAMQADDNICRTFWTPEELEDFIQTKQSVLAEKRLIAGNRTDPRATAFRILRTQVLQAMRAKPIPEPVDE